MLRVLWRKVLRGRDPLEDYRAELKRHPLDADLHFRYAKRCLLQGKTGIAYAELKTAQALGLTCDEIAQYEKRVVRKLAPKESLGHNQYFRLRTLSSTIVSLAAGKPVSILDVGGGAGLLAQFMPDASYCLAEPQVNGISGTDLPFADNSFDYAVACHVLEHVPSDSRELFLDQLAAKARCAVILLNPFHIEGTWGEESTALVMEVTGAAWAEEHLACSAPRIEAVQEYARKRGFRCDIRPDGSLTTAAAMVFVEFFAAKAGLTDERTKVIRFFNEYYSDIIGSDRYPCSYLVVLAKPAPPGHEVTSSMAQGPYNL